METAYAASPSAEARKYDFAYPEQVEAARRLTLVWCKHLSPAEFLLVSWIMGNTVLRGWRSGVYSIPQICSGVPDRKTGGMWAEGTGLSDSGVRKMTASLRERGLLHTEITPRGTRFTVVLSWNPATGQAEESNVVTLNLPRAMRRATTQPVSQVQATDTDGEFDEAPLLSGGGDRYSVPGGTATEYRPSNALPTNSLPTNEELETAAPRRLMLPEIRKRVRPASPVRSLDEQRHSTGEEEPTPRCAAPLPTAAAPVNPRRTLAEAVEAAGVARAARLAEARKKNDTRSLRTTWAAAWAETYPGVGCAEWTIKEAGILSKALKASWPKRHEGRVHEFLEWSILNWDVILGAKLAWMRESPPPALPSIDFLGRMLRKFQEAWAEREELLWRGTLPGTMQEAYALAKREAIPLDTAKAKVIAIQASRKDREANARMVAEARKERELATFAADRASRATRFTAANPHPRAHEMVKEPIKMVPGEPDWNIPAVFFDESKL